MSCTKIDKCQVCFTKNSLVEVLSLPPTPPANEFVKDKVEQKKYPLDLVECNKCGFVQLSVQVNPEILFKNYVYVSGTSQVFVNHFKDYAKSMIEQFNLKKNKYGTPTVLDIGSNDGTLLKAFKEHGLNVVGIDPAQDIAKKANEDGVFTIPEFLNDLSVNQVVEKYGSIDLITANNVFAHTNDLWGFLNHVKSMLADNGVFVFECSYLVDMINNLGFDMCYHEHMYYHSVGALARLFESNDLRMFKVEKVTTHGGSIRVYVCRKNANHKDQSYKSFLQEEVELGLKCDPTILKKYGLQRIDRNIFKEYADKINELKDKLYNKLVEIKKYNKRVVGYGAPAKLCTLTHTFGITEDLIEAVIDDSPLKQNLYSPGLHIPVKSSKYLKDNDIDFIIIFAWNFANSIIKNNADFKGKWIIPIPEFKII